MLPKEAFRREAGCHIFLLRNSYIYGKHSKDRYFSMRKYFPRTFQLGCLHQQAAVVVISARTLLGVHAKGPSVPGTQVAGYNTQVRGQSTQVAGHTQSLTGQQTMATAV